MEYRTILTQQELNKFLRKAKILNTTFVIDEYTGKKRIRKVGEEITTKEYVTPVTGMIFRYSSLCEYKNYKNIWLEFKWTDKTSRFEIEFEEKIPDEFKNRENIKGWNILL